MSTIINQPITSAYAEKKTKASLFKKFITWADGQEKNRLGWLAGALVSHGCILTPITMFAIVLGGNNIIFWFAAIIGMMTVLVTNLAAMPTKYTIPAFLLSVLLDIVIIISCVSIGFDITGTYI